MIGTLTVEQAMIGTLRVEQAVIGTLRVEQAVIGTLRVEESASSGKNKDKKKFSMTKHFLIHTTISSH